MSFQHPTSDCEDFKGYDQNMNCLPPPPPPPPHPPQLSLSNTFSGQEFETSEMGFQILSSPSKQTRKPWIFQPLEYRGAKRTNSGVTDVCFEVDNKKGLSLKLVEDAEGNKSSASRKTGHAKLCARGHWRPAEDAKLRELVAQYGPQNWNLIAENLEGRSGKLFLGKKKMVQKVKAFEL